MKRKILIGVLLLAMIAFLITTILPTRPWSDEVEPTDSSSNTVAPSPSISEPKFIDQGDLYFLRGADTLTEIDIEVAATAAKRQRGLMYRTRLKSDGGMLFIFNDSQPQSFWMKNTYIPLDLLFINEQFQVVQISANTLPSSETPIICNSKSKYVLEVNSGFAEAYGILVGDKISFIME